MVVNNLIEKEEKPEVTINSKNDVKEGKSVDTNIPAIEHFSDDKIQRQFLMMENMEMTSKNLIITMFLK